MKLLNALRFILLITVQSLFLVSFFSWWMSMLSAALLTVFFLTSIYFYIYRRIFHYWTSLELNEALPNTIGWIRNYLKYASPELEPHCNIYVHGSIIHPMALSLPGKNYFFLLPSSYIQKDFNRKPAARILDEVIDAIQSKQTFLSTLWLAWLLTVQHLTEKSTYIPHSPQITFLNLLKRLFFLLISVPTGSIIGPGHGNHEFYSKAKSFHCFDLLNTNWFSGLVKTVGSFNTSSSRIF